VTAEQIRKDSRMPIVGDNVEQEIFVEAKPVDVFPYFTDPALMVRWIGREAKLDARAGGPYQIEINPGDTAAGEYVLIDPPSRLVMTWGWVGSASVPPGATTLEVTLTASDGGTLVRLVHRDLPDAEQRSQHDHGWSGFLSRLPAAAIGADPGPYPFG
jgi:uncharacterized protein YndB with AHSA1/START domain